MGPGRAQSPGQVSKGLEGSWSWRSGETLHSALFGFDARKADQPGMQRGGRLTPLARMARSYRAHLVSTPNARSEEHTSELQSLMRISYAVFCLKKKKK